jgi:hypothetical protein
LALYPPAAPSKKKFTTLGAPNALVSALFESPRRRFTLAAQRLAKDD